MDSSVLQGSGTSVVRQPLGGSAPPASPGQTQPRPTGTSVTVVMPTTDFSATFTRCARRAVASLRLDLGDECIVVLDGPAIPVPPWLTDAGVLVMATGRVAGPAAARNVGARRARGEAVLFVDADVEPAADALERVRDAFDADPDLTGIFGAYDDEPSAPDIVSRFRNLLHHHTHVRHAGPAETFWSGCGAMRTGPFLGLGGFDQAYEHPSIEDIELGVRASAAGRRLRLDPSIRCTHHKRWTLASMIHTDVFRRAVPWTRLVLSAGGMPKRLSLDLRSRASGVLAVFAVASLVAGTIAPAALLAAVGFLAALLALNCDFYALCRRRHGLPFASGCFLLHWLYFTYAAIAFGAVHFLERFRRIPGRCPS